MADGGSFHLEIEFSETFDPKAHEKPALRDMEDHYEVLQLSANADTEMIHRVYRLMAQRCHPDNQETGDAGMFKRVLEAYRTLSDPEKRAAYDATHAAQRKLRWRIFNQAKAAQGLEGEKSKRQGVLGLLYTKRAQTTESAGMNSIEMEDLLGVPREHLEFTLWYLKESGLVQRGDNARFSITIKGVDFAESQGTSWAKPEQMITSREESTSKAN